VLTAGRRGTGHTGPGSVLTAGQGSTGRTGLVAGLPAAGLGRVPAAGGLSARRLVPDFTHPV